MSFRIGQIIGALRKRKGLRQSDLAETSGLKQPNLSRIENGLVEPRRATLARVAEALGVELELLLDERSWPKLGLALPAAPGAQYLTPAAVPGERGANVAGELALQTVPLFSASAGKEIDFGDGDHPVGQSDVFMQIPGSPGARFATRIVGDSMESASGGDSFREGDIAIFGEGEVRSGDFAFVRTASSSTFKQVFFEGKYLRLVPLNRAYQEKRIHRSEVVQLWRLLQHVKEYV